MKTCCSILFFLLLYGFTKAQTVYGHVSLEELNLKKCPFDKDASAMVLFKTGKLYVEPNGNYTITVHKRIKIFDANGLVAANISLPVFLSRDGENITDIKAETFNTVNNNPVITVIGPDQVYSRLSDKKNKTTIKFSMPDVKVGCVVEYSYKFTTPYFMRVSNWAFQDVLPVGYSLFDCTLPASFSGEIMSHVNMGFSTDTLFTEQKSKQNYKHWIKAVNDIPAFVLEPYMSSPADNFQRIEFVNLLHKPLPDFSRDSTRTWANIALKLSFWSALDDKNISLKGEKDIIKKAANIKDTTQKIAFIFNTVKNVMDSDDSDNWQSDNDAQEAWKNKTGTPTEINLILLYLLHKTGVNAFPLVVSTKSNGRVNPNYPYLSQFNRVVVDASLNNKQVFILDASDKTNSYNEVPQYLLNTYALSLGTFNGYYSGIVYLKNTVPLNEVALITGKISPSAQLSGTAQLSSNGYNKKDYLKAHSELIPEKYKELFFGSNGPKIESVALENELTDSLPLVQNITFKYEMVTSDKYIFLQPYLFTNINPFLNRKRNTDIDFGFLTVTSINCVYKIPEGYKLLQLPVNISMNMPDQSIAFKRLLVNDNGKLTIRYIINPKQSYFSKDIYPSLYDFYKKMYNYINEQIILEKI